MSGADLLLDFFSLWTRYESTLGSLEGEDDIMMSMERRQIVE